MTQDVKHLKEMRQRQEKVLRETRALQESIDRFRQEIASEVQAVLERTRYTIKKTEEEELPLLPPPLLPAAVTAPPAQQLSLEQYQGISSQRTNIPSISCDNVTLDEKK